MRYRKIYVALLAYNLACIIVISFTVNFKITRTPICTRRLLTN